MNRFLKKFRSRNVKSRARYVGVLVLVAVATITFWQKSDVFANSATGSTWAYDVPGTYTWVAPSDIHTVYLRLVGAGGGGASGQGPSQNSGCDCVTGYPGSAGGVITKTMSVTSGQNYTVTVGKGGSGGPRVYTGYCPYSIGGSGGGASSFDTASVPGGGAGSSGCIYTGVNCPYGYTGSSNGSGYGQGGTGTSCNGGGGAGGSGFVKISTIPPPMLSIVGNDQNPVTVIPGQSVVIDARFAPSEGDTLTKSAINDSNNSLWCGSGVTCSTSLWSTSLNEKNYTFTPARIGTYTFYPAAQTTEYPWWDNYNKSLTVTAACPANSTTKSSKSTSVCTCNSGYTQQPDGTCIAAPCTNGATNPPTCNVCNPGYTLTNGQCVLVTSCTDPLKQPPLCTSCIAGYSLVGGSCVKVPSVSLSASATLVRSGDTPTLTWRVTGAGSGVSCTISSDPTGLFSASNGDLKTGTWSGSAQTGPITSKSIFTLSCTNAAPVSVSISLIPSVKEI